MVDDPLRSLQGQEKLLFEVFAQAASGRNLDAVMGAAVNVIINAIRQSVAKRSDAEIKLDELFGRTKTLLLDAHYDSVTGLRRNVFPHDQVISMPHHFEDDRIRP